MEKSSKKIRLQYSKLISACLVIFDLAAMGLSYFLALWLRFDGKISQIDQAYADAYLKFLPIYLVVGCVIFLFCGMYRSLWKYVSLKEGLRAVLGSLIASVVHCVGITFFCRMPISYYLFGSVLQLLLLVAARFFYRFVLFIVSSLDNSEADSDSDKVMIIGAGDAGQLIIRDIIRSDKVKEKICCIIDDDKNKWHRSIEGIKVAGGRDVIVKYAEKYKVSKIYIAIPSASKSTLKEIIEICSNTDAKIKTLPGMYQFVTEDIGISKMKSVTIEDLLGRDVIKTDMSEINEFLHGKTILVTGGGGSIGSELCRQIAAQNPKCLIIFDIYENNAYDIQLELKHNYPELNLQTLIGSVRDSRRLKQIFETYRPDVVYHAAAHKHVPLMEDSPNEAIKNNVIGTYKTAWMAMMYGVKRFVLISTDKAVNPTNIMGASKRLCEMVVQSFDHKIKEGKANEIPLLFTHEEKDDSINDLQLPEKVCTEYVAVRFGNVLGSNGSVIPLFRRQIEAGGPVTVTHPDIIRYFMTIPEAVSLVLTAGTFAKGGEIFVLDMGSPVKIDTLARNFIRLSGYKPDVDIEIKYTGLRPGEKLYEEKLMAEEGLRKTKNELIHIGCPIPFDVDEFNAQMAELMETAYSNSDDIKDAVAKIVSTYKRQD